MNRLQAIEAFEENGFSKNPLQFVSESINTNISDDGFVRYGIFSLEPSEPANNPVCNFIGVLRSNRVNSLTISDFTLFTSIPKLMLIDEWSITGDNGLFNVFFIGYKMKK